MAHQILQTLMYYLLLKTASTFSTTTIRGITQRRLKNFRNYKLRQWKLHSMASNTGSAVADSWAHISPAIEEPKFIPSNAMISHLTSKISWALQTWEGADEIDESARMDIAKNVVDAIVRNKESNASLGDERQQNKVLANYGMTVAKALRVTPGSLYELNKDFMLLEKTINQYQQHLEKNRAVYLNINKHHETMITKSYTAAVSNATSLEVYAEAANSMGKKVWVQEGNLWIERFSIQFFRGNGARKDYLKAMNHDPSNAEHRELATSLPKDIMLEETFSDASFSSSNTAKKKEEEDAAGNVLPLQPARLIRLVDVGSCYNPIGKSENAGAFCVTALDLCPVDPSVYQCDFLELGIGPRGSSPVFHRKEADSSCVISGSSSVGVVAINEGDGTSGVNGVDGVRGVDKGSESQSQSVVSEKLLQLPAESYDAVSMSLVLNYLPTPVLREDMIRKARQLLIPPGDAGQPHRAGILLITEKESIFSNDKKGDVEEGLMVSKSSLLESWISTIESLGFKLVKYRNILTQADHRRYHALAFRTTLLSKEHSAEHSSEISLNNFPEHSSTLSPIENLENNEKESNTDNKNENFMLQKSVENLKLFKSGKTGMWIKQDFTTGRKLSENTFNKKHVEFNNVMKSKRGVLGGAEKAGSTDFLGSTVITTTPSHPIPLEAESSNRISTFNTEIQQLIPDLGLSSDPTTDYTIENNSKNVESSSSATQSTLSCTTSDKGVTMLPVAIVGGGLGGCALALALQRKGIPYVMYEKDPHFTSRKQGYALTLMQVSQSF
jgi:25S rRNA (adenine(2142)-N(1))-methyltransferase, Bmt2